MNGYTVHHNGNGDNNDNFHINVGADVVARYNFNGNSAEDLPFQKNEMLRIVTITKVHTYSK